MYLVEGIEKGDSSLLGIVVYLASSPSHSSPTLSSHLLPPTLLLHLRVHLLHLSRPKMQYTGMTYRVPPTVPEMLYPPGVQVENTLRVWAISRWRGARELTEYFLSAGYRHLPRGSPVMFRV